MIELHSNAQKEILEFIKTHENGATEKMLSTMTGTLSKPEIVTALNILHQKSLIEVQRIDGELVYKAAINKNNSYEALILNLIAQGGASGLWLKDIKNKTNIPHNLVLKILKVLEDSKKIKSIKSVKNNRKTYVMFDVKPDEDVSGGVWFSNNDVDLIFVNKLMEIIYQFVKKPESAFVLNKLDNLTRLRMVKEFISTCGISEVELSIEDINTLIDCLVFDGKIEKLEVENEIALRALKEDYYKL
ncbi:DNA-directed RNA polymerase III subunit RPC6 [Glugoides intestinalis]